MIVIFGSVNTHKYCLLAYFLDYLKTQHFSAATDDASNKSQLGKKFGKYLIYYKRVHVVVWQK